MTYLPDESEALESVRDLLKSSFAGCVSRVVRRAEETASFVETLHERSALDRLFTGSRLSVEGTGRKSREKSLTICFWRVSRPSCRVDSIAVSTSDA